MEYPCPQCGVSISEMSALLHAQFCRGELPRATELSAVEEPTQTTSVCPRCTFGNAVGAEHCVMCDLELAVPSDNELIAAAIITREGGGGDDSGNAGAPSAPPLPRTNDEDRRDDVRPPDATRRERLLGPQSPPSSSSSSSSSRPGADGGGTKWACSRCTYFNQRSARRCEACGARVAESDDAIDRLRERLGRCLMLALTLPLPLTVTLTLTLPLPLPLLTRNSIRQSMPAPGSVETSTSTSISTGTGSLVGAAACGVLGGLLAMARGRSVMSGAMDGAMLGYLTGAACETVNDLNEAENRHREGSARARAEGQVSAGGESDGGSDNQRSLNIWGDLAAAEEMGRMFFGRGRGGGRRRSETGGRPAGMSRRRIEQFPVASYQSRTNTDGEVEEDCCQVCLETFSAGEMVRTLGCLHRYHPACVDQWLERSASCPICKTDFGR